MFKYHVHIGFVFLAMVIVGNVILYFYLPENLVMQITASGADGFTLPKLVGQGILILIGAALGLQMIFKKTEADFRRWLLAMAIMLLVNVLVAIFNL